MKTVKLKTTLPLFLGLLSFFAGGFYAFLAFPVALYLSVWLMLRSKKAGGLRLCLSLESVAVLLVVLAYGLTAFWGIDRGLAWWGFVKFIPLVLYAAVLMQLDQQEREETLCLIPLAGVIMTLGGTVLQFIPVLQTRIMPNGQFAGFFEYPNTYALFALLGIILLFTAKEIKPRFYLYAAVLLLGICFSGSRTTGILLVMAVVVMLWGRKELRSGLCMVGVLLAAGAVYVLADRLGLKPQADAGLSTGTDTGTLLVRWLYFKDALRMILTHPFGLGYLGYSFLQGSVQTSVYHVTYVHNELLQLFLDVGWIPVLVLVAALAKSFFGKGAGLKNRLLMFVILAHAMMDFDLQFLSVWFILLSMMNFAGKRQRVVKLHSFGAASVCGIGLLAMLWLCAGDFCYNFGWNQACLQLTPFHTSALTKELPGQTDVYELGETADKILDLNSHVSLAYSAKANAALAEGQVLSVMDLKKQAILNSRYELEEYLDYFDKLHAIMTLYRNQGDMASAEICRQKILEIPEMIQQVLEETDPQAWNVKHKPELELPQEYLDMLEQLQK